MNATARFATSALTLVENLQRHAATTRLAPLEPAVLGAAEQMWAAQRRLVLERIGRALAPLFPAAERAGQGDWDRIWLAIAAETSRMLSRQLDASLAAALGQGAAAVVGQVGIDLAFDVRTDAEAVAWLEGRAASRVTGINDSTRAQLNTIITRGGVEGRSWQAIAAEIEERFDGFSAPSPLGHLRSRGELVAVTELAEAFEHGQTLSRGRLADAGLKVEKSWLTVGDDRVDPDCIDNEADGWIAENDSFASGATAPPDHAGCRCASLTRVAEPT